MDSVTTGAWGSEKPATQCKGPLTPHTVLDASPPHLSPKTLGDLLKGYHVSTPSPPPLPQTFGVAPFLCVRSLDNLRQKQFGSLSQMHVAGPSIYTQKHKAICGPPAP